MTAKQFIDYIKNFKDIEDMEVVIQIGNNFPEKLKLVHFKKEEDTFKIHINPRSFEKC